MTLVYVPPTAETVASLRFYIDERFADIGDCSFTTLRSIAHDALDRLLAGNHLAANIGIAKLGASANDFRNELRRLGIELEPAT